MLKPADMARASGPSVDRSAERRRRLKERRSRVAYLYVDEKLSLHEIAARERVSFATIRNDLESLGIPRRSPAEGRTIQAKRDAEELRNRVEALYGTGLSLAEVGLTVGRSREAVRRHLIRAEVPRRPRLLALRIVAATTDFGRKVSASKIGVPCPWASLDRDREWQFGYGAAAAYIERRASGRARQRWLGRWGGRAAGKLGGRPRVELDRDFVTEVQRLGELGWGRKAIADRLKTTEHRVRLALNAG